MSLAETTLIAAGALVFYTFIGYPALLRAIGRVRRAPAQPRTLPPEPPYLSITVPAYNEERQIAAALDALLALEYPADRRQILVVSDCSSDRTDEIVRSYADRGVELLRLERRTGKTGAEAAARPLLRGDIILNTDASVRLHPAAARHLVAALGDPTVGVASGRDISVARSDDDANAGESGYVGYEMAVRRLETAISGIVGSSGCLYAIRRELHMVPLPPDLSRDFGSALIAREHGLRAVSVDDALCYVPRTPSLRREFRRKVRTAARGLRTLLHKRHLMNPFRHGLFAWMLFSHKLCRWLLPWAFAAGLLACLALARVHAWAFAAALAAGIALAVAAIAWRMPEDVRLPRPLALPAYFVTGMLATMVAWFRLFAGQRDAVWEPTRRDSAGQVGAI